MEYGLWNLHGPTLWPPSSNVSRTVYSTVNGETLGDIHSQAQEGIVGEIQVDPQGGMQGRLRVDIEDVVHSEIIHSDIQTDIQTQMQNEIHSDIGTVIHSEIHTEMQEVIPTDMDVCSGQPGYIAMKPTNPNEQMDLLVNHSALGLDQNLVVDEPDSVVLKVQTHTPKRMKVQRPRRSPSGRPLLDSEELEPPGTILPPVDNLWNNGIVGANVNVKTESVLPLTYIDDPKDLGPSPDEPVYNLMLGRLPSKRLEPLSDESEEEEEEEEEGGAGNDNRGIQSSSSVLCKQNFMPRLNMSSTTSSKVGFECGECGFTADTRPGLKRHITMVHPAPVPDSNLAHALMRKLSQSSGCPISACRFRAGDRNEMEAHVARHVSEGCAPTPKKKTVPTNLQRVRYEREEYRCQMCSYSCTIEKAFYKHLKLHSVGSAGPATVINSPNTSHKISCVICGKDRPTEADMNKHMRKHRDNRYFLCDICVFRTVQLKKLIQHRRMHTGEKPHLCPHCPYRSARRDNLRSHVRRVHKKDNLFCDTFSPRGLVPGSSVSSPTHSQD